MAQATLVDDSIQLGQQFLKSFAAYARVDLAFWHQEQEEPHERLLFVYSHEVTTQNRDIAYGEIFRVASQVRLDPFKVRLMDENDPMLHVAVQTLGENVYRLPVRLLGNTFTGLSIEPFYFYKIPGDLTMSTTGIDTLHMIIDEEATFFEREGRDPKKMKLPVLMAYDLAKCGRAELGELAGKIFKDGISVLEREGFHGMKVEIIRDRNAKLEFE